MPENRYDIVVLSGTKVGFPNLEDLEPDQWQAIFLSADQYSPRTNVFIVVFKIKFYVLI